MTISNLKSQILNGTNLRNAALLLSLAFCAWLPASQSDGDQNASAQEPPPPKPESTSDEPQPDATPAKEQDSNLRLPDPTVPGPELRQLLQRPKRDGVNVVPALPTVTIKGRVFSTEENGVALVEIDKQLFRVRTGQTIRLPGLVHSTADKVRNTILLQDYPIHQT